MNALQTLSLKKSFPKQNISQLAEEAWYRLGRLSVDALKHMLFQLDIVYHTPIPGGAKLLCANHPTTVDPAMMTTLVPEQVSILISETLFKVPALGPSLAASGHIRVVHSNGRPALEEGIQALQAGRTVGIFPEGAISPQVEGQPVSLARAHTGAARLAISAGVPVIPVGIALKKENILRVETVVDGKLEIGTWYLHGPYAMTIGAPLTFTGDVNDREAVHQATEQIMQHIEALALESAYRLERLAEQPAGDQSFNLPRLPWFNRPA